MAAAWWWMEGQQAAAEERAQNSVVGLLLLQQGERAGRPLFSATAIHPNPCVHQRLDIFRATPITPIAAHQHTSGRLFHSTRFVQE